MDYQTFVETFRLMLAEISGLDKERLYFQKEGGRLSEAGDRLLIEFAEHDESREICALHTEELYELYQSGQQLEELATEVISDIEEAKASQIYMRARELSDYEKIRGELFIRLVNEERNRRSLADAIFRRVGDIALVVYVRMAENENGLSSARVPDKYVSLWGMSRESVFNEALLNTYLISAPRIYRWEGLIFDPEYTGEKFMDTSSEYSLVKGEIGNCLSTERKINGAVAVFLPGVAERLYELLESDFYIVFTSIHEAMIHHAETAKKEALQDVLKYITEEVTEKEEFLSSRVYYYSHETEEFSCVTGEEDLPALIL